MGGKWVSCALTLGLCFGSVLDVEAISRLRTKAPAAMFGVFCVYALAGRNNILRPPKPRCDTAGTLSQHRLPCTLLDCGFAVERTRRGPGQFAAGCCRPILLVGFGQPFPGCGRGFYQQTINRHQFDRYTMTPFDRALGVVLGHEGGDSDHAADPGGFTRFGISQVAHPTVDVRNLTREGAAEIYRAEYWQPMQCDELPPPLALCVFDCAVNQGRTAAIRLLQETVGTTVDGVLGSKTLAAVYRHPVPRLLRRFMVARSHRYIATGGFSTFGRGWLARAIDVAMTAAEWEMEDAE